MKVVKRLEVLRLQGEVTNVGTDTMRVGAGAKARALLGGYRRGPHGRAGGLSWSGNNGWKQT